MFWGKIKILVEIENLIFFCFIRFLMVYVFEALRVLCLNMKNTTVSFLYYWTII
jgi:hypothetical protein